MKYNIISLSTTTGNIGIYSYKIIYHIIIQLPPTTTAVLVAARVETQKNPNINFSFVYVRISTLLVEPVPTLCPTLSGTKYSKRSDFVARVTIQVAGGFLHHFVYEFFLI